MQISTLLSKQNCAIEYSVKTYTWILLPSNLLSLKLENLEYNMGPGIQEWTK